MMLSEDRDRKCAEFADLRVDRGRVRPLWFSGFYDVPRDGMATFDGRLVWYESDWTDRDYWLVELTEEEIVEETLVHEDFVHYVGLHSNVDERGRCYPLGRVDMPHWKSSIASTAGETKST